MAMNKSPVFPLTPVVSFSDNIQTAITTVNGDISSAALIFTGHATNGSRLDFIRVRALGTNVATVLRVFINNGSTAATATNNCLVTEATIAATTLSQVAALAETTITMDMAVPPGYKIYVTIGTSVAAGLKVSAHGGDY